MKTNKNCIYCGEKITLNKEDLQLLEDGEISFSSIDCCDGCCDNQNMQEECFLGSDADCGL